MLPKPERADEFRSYTLPLADNLFEELFASVRFEAVGKGRLGTVLVKSDESGQVPIVRTTTRYSTPAQSFRPVHEQLAQQIQTAASLAVGFNNALIESYSNAYTTMGSHSDQALDLAEGSFVAVFSCYQHPERVSPPRKLIIESKEPGGGTFDVSLNHNSVIIFSVCINKIFKHKIVLNASKKTPENQWLGITFRTSKTFVRFRDEHAYFLDDTRLTLADEEQRREFFRLRRRENEETDFVYPRVAYTISESDLMPPEPGGARRERVGALGGGDARG